MSKILLPVVVIVVGWFVASPYIAAYELEQAIQNNDMETIREQVDFVALRQSLKDIMQDRIAEYPGFREENDPFGIFGVMLAGGITDSVIDIV